MADFGFSRECFWIDPEGTTHNVESHMGFAEDLLDKRFTTYDQSVDALLSMGWVRAAESLIMGFGVQLGNVSTDAAITKAKSMLKAYFREANDIFLDYPGGYAIAKSGDKIAFSELIQEANEFLSYSVSSSLKLIAKVLN